MRRWVLAGLAGLVLGVALGASAGLLRRRPVPDRERYLPPSAAETHRAVGPHRARLRAVPDVPA
jgi:hypothetical protein